MLNRHNDLLLIASGLETGKEDFLIFDSKYKGVIDDCLGNLFLK